MSILFVSVNRSFDDDGSTFTLARLAECVRGDWALSASKAGQADVVVAVWRAEPIAAWSLVGAYPALSPSDEERVPDKGPWSLSTSPPRCRLSLGEPLPVLPRYRNVPNMRRGVAIELRHTTSWRVKDPKALGGWRPHTSEEHPHSNVPDWMAQCACGWATSADGLTNSQVRKLVKEHKALANAS